MSGNSVQQYASKWLLLNKKKNIFWDYFSHFDFGIIYVWTYSFQFTIIGVLESNELKEFFTDFLGGPVLTFDWKVRNGMH